MAENNSDMDAAGLRCRRECVATNVRRLRNRRDWSQRDLAQRAKIDRTHLARFESQGINISLDVLLQLAAALEVEAERLLEGCHREDCCCHEKEQGYNGEASAT